MIFSIHVTGLGGQGVLTLTRLLAGYTEDRGFKTTLFNSKGMAQRGGRVTSDIRVSDQPEGEFDPRIADGAADILVGMELGEALNSQAVIHPEGTVLLYGRRIIPTSVVMDKKGWYPGFDDVRGRFETRARRVHLVPSVDAGANVYMLGVLCASLPEAGAFFEVPPDQFTAVLRGALKRDIDENIDAFTRGYEYGQSVTKGL